LTTERPLRQAWSFVRAHRWHLAAAPVAAVTVVTLLHELAHAALVWLQGGTVRELSFLPSGSSYGFVSFDPPASGLFFSELVSLAPYAMWFAMATAVALVAWWRSQPTRWAPFLFVWGYAVPLLDVANAAVPYALGGSNDLSQAFGPAEQLGLELVWSALAVLTGASVLVAYAIQRRLYGPRSLGAVAFAIVSVTAGGGLLVAITAIGALL